jgi:hypothetical protein
LQPVGLQAIIDVMNRLISSDDVLEIGLARQSAVRAVAAY